MSYSPKRWFVPPPMRTAHFSMARSVGVVLRVSSTRQPVPSTASTKRRVRVDTPLMRCMKLSSVRSTVTMLRAAPVSVKATSPLFTEAPSWMSTRNFRVGSKWAQMASASSTPASTPSCFTNNRAAPRASAGMVASAVWSPSRMSSTKARCTSSSVPSGSTRAYLLNGSMRNWRTRN